MTQPEFTAVILAATCGSRLYPLTISGDDDNQNALDESNEFNDYLASTTQSSSSSKQPNKKHSNYLPKHLLPIAGRPILHHLLEKLQLSNLQHVIIAISSIDEVTIPSLLEMGASRKSMNQKPTSSGNNNGNGKEVVECFELSRGGHAATTTAVSAKNKNQKIINTLNTLVKVVRLPSDCSGSADALRFITSIQAGSGSGVKEEKSRTTSGNDKDKNHNMNGNDNSDDDDDDDDDDDEQQNKQNYKNDNGLISNGSHVMVMSADLVLYGNLCIDDLDDDNNPKNHDRRNDDNTGGVGDSLGSLADVHRANYYLGSIGEGPPLAMTVVLSDVGECDANGIPLKESAKAKKGGLSREDEDIEYIALSEVQAANNFTAQRIIVKQAKFNVEEDEDNLGKTPKLTLPKARLHPPIHQISIGKDWNDVHLYCLSPWVMKIIMTKVHLKDLAKEVLPLLVECQFQGIKACLGISRSDKFDDDDDDEDEKKDDDMDDEKVQVLTQLLADAPFTKNYNFVRLGNSNGGDDGMNTPKNPDMAKDYPFTVLAMTLPHTSSKLTLRACDVSSYSYACREVVTQAFKSKTSADIKLSLPSDAKVDTKFSSVIMQNCCFGDKVQIKSSTIGKNVTVGNRCRLNNVVVMDDVKIGQNCILQNSVISRGCTIEDNCNLNDCQLGPNYLLEHGTKGKGESYVEDNIQ